MAAVAGLGSGDARAAEHAGAEGVSAHTWLAFRRDLARAANDWHERADAAVTRAKYRHDTIRALLDTLGLQRLMTNVSDRERFRSATSERMTVTENAREIVAMGQLLRSAVTERAVNDVDDRSNRVRARSSSAPFIFVRPIAVYDLHGEFSNRHRRTKMYVTVRDRGTSLNVCPSVQPAEDFAGVARSSCETHGRANRMGNRFGGERRSSTAPISLARERAEILDLIRRLAAERSVRQRDLHGKTTRLSSRPPPAVGGATSEVRSRESVTNGNAIEGLEQRLRRVEEALLRKPARSSRPPPVDATAMFSGLIRGQMLSDMLQLVSSNNMSGEFVVQSGDSKCTLYFDDGRIRHAQAPGLEGEQAFFAAFGFESGRYYFIETTELPDAKTIEAGTQFLILEALRQIDESKTS